jgi:ATP-dependent RNA helicase DDX49/DBP8
MSNDYSSSRESDEDIMEAQMGSRKRRKPSPEESDSDTEQPVLKPSTVSTISRVKPATGRVAAKPISSVPEPTNGPSEPSSSKEKVSFASINVAPWLVASLAGMEIKRPTGIQRACIPEILKGRDCIGGSRTGTGKTVAFSAPILQKWAEDPSGIFGLIIT